MKRTKIITEYSGISFNLQDHIQKLAQREADILWGRKWIDGGLPAYEKPKKEKLSVGLWNFIRSFRP